MGQIITRWKKPILIVISALLVWWALDYFIGRPIPHLDVSNHAQYAPIVGKRFRTQHELMAIGYTIDRNYKKKVDYIFLVKPPGFSGPEVVAKGMLPKDSILEVTAILKADSWLVNRMKYAVKRLDGSQPIRGQMVIDVNVKSSINFGLPETEFILINESKKRNLGLSAVRS
ncbi:MAG: hypothetical protein OEY52_04370 [Gammaproteobacteria bacterium]|nr:hypothetical protein [Gammaproteobacteria bacterium]